MKIHKKMDTLASCNSKWCKKRPKNNNQRKSGVKIIKAEKIAGEKGENYTWKKKIRCLSLLY